MLIAASAWPGFAEALVIPPLPPSSPFYLLFIANGVYQISKLKILDVPAEAGNCRNYNKSLVSIAFTDNFTYTQRSGIGVWNQLLNAPSYRWYEYIDRRTGNFVRLWLGDRLEARFSDKSRVKVVFNGPGAAIDFTPLVGTERLPDGSLLFPNSDACHCHGDGRPRGSKDNSVIAVKPSTTTFSWSWSSQETPW